MAGRFLSGKRRRGWRVMVSRSEMVLHLRWKPVIGVWGSFVASSYQPHISARECLRLPHFLLGFSAFF